MSDNITQLNPIRYVIALCVSCLIFKKTFYFSLTFILGNWFKLNA